MLLLLIPLLFSLACAAPAEALLISEGSVTLPNTLPISIVFATDFPKEYEQQVKDGIAFWNRQAGQQILRAEEYDQSEGIAYVQFSPITEIEPYSCDEWNKKHEENNARRRKNGEKETDDVCTPAHEYANVRHLGSDFSHMTLFKDWRDASNTTRQSVIRHELGHVLGFEHYGNRACLMYPVVSDTGFPKELCAAESEEFKTLLKRTTPIDIFSTERP